MAEATNFWIRWRVRIGYPVALVYLALACPMPRSLIIGSGIGVVGLTIRAWAAGHLRKHEALAVGGPYAFTRNPLYFGSVILAAGLVVASASIWATLVVAAYLILFYPAVMRREELELQAHYGESFREYASDVPLFWPKFRRFKPESAERFSGSLYRKNREYQAAIGLAIGIVLLWIRMRWLP